MTDHMLNFAPIELRGHTEVLVGRQSYSADRLRELRREFYKTHIFQRIGADETIIDIPVVAGVTPVGNLRNASTWRRCREFGRDSSLLPFYERFVASATSLPPGPSACLAALRVD